MCKTESRLCARCGVDIQAKHSNATYCSEACRVSAYRDDFLSLKTSRAKIYGDAEYDDIPEQSKQRAEAIASRLVKAGFRERGGIILAPQTEKGR